jgi:hypothetical protein
MSSHFTRIVVKEFRAPGVNDHAHSEVWSVNPESNQYRPMQWETIRARYDAVAHTGLCLKVTRSETRPWRGGTVVTWSLEPTAKTVCEASYERHGWTITLSLMLDPDGMWLVGRFGDKRVIGPRVNDTAGTVKMFGTEEAARAYAREQHADVMAAGYTRKVNVTAA